MKVNSTSGTTYSCNKCNSTDWDVGEIRTSGGLWSAVFEVDTTTFTSLTCNHCHYTEFYRVRKSRLASVVDFFIG